MRIVCVKRRKEIIRPLWVGLKGCAIKEVQGRFFEVCKSCVVLVRLEGKVGGQGCGTTRGTKGLAFGIVLRQILWVLPLLECGCRTRGAPEYYWFVGIFVPLQKCFRSDVGDRRNPRWIGFVVFVVVFLYKPCLGQGKGSTHVGSIIVIRIHTRNCHGLVW